MAVINRFSSRRQRLDRSFLADRLRGARSYDRIAGYFSSSLLEIVGEELESISGPIRVVCNSDLNPQDVETARAAAAVRRSWCAAQPEKLLAGPGETVVRQRFERLYAFLSRGKLEVRVLPDAVFGLIHGKAGVLTLADGTQTSFLGSANESRLGWQVNYELIWEDSSPDAVAWVQQEFDELWVSPRAVPLAEAVIEDIQRLAYRRVILQLGGVGGDTNETPDPAPAIVEAPVNRKGDGLWQHQKYFAKTVFDAHNGPLGKARYVLADQVGLGKTLQLAMSAQLIALTGSKPILVICPKTLLWQWQNELNELLDMPSAVWNGRQWIDEQGIAYPVQGPDGIRRCPRRLGIVSGGLMSRGSEAASHLLALEYDCVILDEAHRARRRNLGERRDGESPEPNNLLRFMYQIAERTRSLLLATATPVQLRPIEAWDLLDVLSRGDESVLGNRQSRWRRADEALALMMDTGDAPDSDTSQWEWLRNPMPPATEHRDFDLLRRVLGISNAQSIVDGSRIVDLPPARRARIPQVFEHLVEHHNPFIQRIIRRTRQQLEQQIDPETKRPLLDPIQVEVLGESDADRDPLARPIILTNYLREAYTLAEDFCQALGTRVRGAGFLRTLLLRRVGSTIHAGHVTASRMLAGWTDIEESDEEDDDERDEPAVTLVAREMSRTLTPSERELLSRFVAALDANREQDPKYERVRAFLVDRRWLSDYGCIVFSQYRDSIQWLAQQLTNEAALREEPIALYSGTTTSGIMRGGIWTPTTRETLKQMVQRGELRLMLGTDAASEGLNLQRLGRLINLDLPWNPTRLEQRKGRIQRIGQVHAKVQVLNMRYRDSVEDRVHQLLSNRLQDIYHMFGQIPDVLEDVWVALAMGEREQAEKLLNEVPQKHPFELRYTNVETVDWESCTTVLDVGEKLRVLRGGWS